MYRILEGDVVEQLKTLADESVDAIVTDPPYELSENGKASPNRVLFEFMFPDYADGNVERMSESELLGFVRQILLLGCGGILPTETATMPIRAMALDKQSLLREIKIKDKSEPASRVAEGDGAHNWDAEENKGISSLQLKLADPAHLFEILDEVGAGFDAGGVWVGFSLSSASLPSFLGHSQIIRRVLDEIGVDADTFAKLVCASRGAENKVMLRLDLSGAFVHDGSAITALVFFALFEIAGAEFIRTSTGASCLPPKFKTAQFRLVNPATHRAFAFDCLIHPTSISSKGFMGKGWDGSKVAFSVSTWQAALRVLKPGGYLLAFGGSRTYHRLACAVEDAGFEIRDQIMWIYGCLDEQTELVAESGVKPYHKSRIGERVLCYDLENGEYSYQPILEIVEYDYCDTAYRLIGDFGEQVVTRSHRCVVEQSGSEVFQFAETLGAEARVPVLEGLPELQQALSGFQSNPGSTEKIMQPKVRQGADWESQQRSDTTRREEGEGNNLCSLRNQEVGSVRMVEESEEANMQPQVQRRSQGRGVEEACAQGTKALDTGVGVSVEDTDDRREQSRVEGRTYLPETQGRLCGPIDQIRPLPAGISEHGAEGRLCDGTSFSGCSSDRQTAVAKRNSASPKSSGNRERTDEPHAICEQRGAQGIRAWHGHQTVVVRVVPFHYEGKVWCLRVPTGAFVAVRNGVAFPTGNSGFPKSLDVSKAIQKQGTGNREQGIGKTQTTDCWSGWGTALKPAHEPVVVARKPLIGTVAANVLQYGTGAMNIDGCRVEYEMVADGNLALNPQLRNHINGGNGGNIIAHEENRRVVIPNQQGRWPANVIHDGSEEVKEVFAHYGDHPSGQSNGGAAVGESSQGAVPPLRRGTLISRTDTGSAARFFYCAKASREERNRGCEALDKKPLLWSSGTQSPGTFQGEGTDRSARNFHPTVKPIALMRYLCRLVTPPGGTVLDCFMGSGSTGIAALQEGFNFIGIEVNPEYVEIARRRIEADAPLFNKTADSLQQTANSKEALVEEMK